jgi:CRP/FNR family transcriptional regulator, cyclic AMP receptor protein
MPIHPPRRQNQGTSSTAQKPATSNLGAGRPRKLKRGEMLFTEGENSRAMYFLKSGMMRIFKAKGNSKIEIDTVRSGQILGELAFLDGQSRSASVEALTDCDLVEISEQTFAQTMTRIPDWLKLLLKTVVGRLRTANTRIRQLESASTSFDYSKEGKASTYIYLSRPDVLKALSAIMLSSSLHGEKEETGIKVRMNFLQRYGNQISGIPISKLTDVLEFLSQLKIISIPNPSELENFIVHDLDLIRRFTSYYNEQNILEHSKRHNLSLKGFMIMSYIAKDIKNKTPPSDSGELAVNIAAIKEVTSQEVGKEAFRLDEFPELVSYGFATNLEIKSKDNAETTVKK